MNNNDSSIRVEAASIAILAFGPGVEAVALEHLLAQIQDRVASCPPADADWLATAVEASMMVLMCRNFALLNEVASKTTLPPPCCQGWSGFRRIWRSSGESQRRDANNVDTKPLDFNYFI